MEPLMAILGTLAFGHSVFLAVFFWMRKRGRQLSNKLLAGLLLALAIRITKSVLVVLIPSSGIWAPSLGLVGMVIIGPLLLLYVSSVLKDDFQWSKRQCWHFAFPLVVAISVVFIGDATTYLLYRLGVAQMLGYLAISFLFLKGNLSSYTDIELKKWLWLLWAAITAIWAVFFLQLHVETAATYMLVTTIATTVLYGLSIWGMGRMGIFSKNKKRESGLVPGAAELAQEIHRLFENEKIYTDSNLTVTSLASQLNVPPYQVSRTVNELFGKTFPELLNEYRIAESSKRLLQPASDLLSIEGIAMESGFNSLSAFYTAFKKIKGVTPAEWRRQRTFS